MTDSSIRKRGDEMDDGPKAVSRVEGRIGSQTPRIQRQSGHYRFERATRATTYAG
jgi:hypothetical protein